MQITKNIESTNATLTIHANETDLSPIKQHVLTHFQPKVKAAGFREGKVPLAMVEKNVDPNVFQTEFLEEAINNLYVAAIGDQKLRAVSRPEVKLTKFVPYTELEFTAEVPVVGEVKLGDYKKLKGSKSEVKVTAKDVDDVVKSLQTRMAEKKDVDRKAKEGDQVWIDFDGVNEKGEKIEGADGKDYPLVLGSNTFIPGFEDNLSGMSAGEQKEFTLTFPKDYGVKALAGKKVTFTVNVTKVQEVIEPKADDEFAKKTGPFDSLKKLKEDIKKQLEQERQNQADRDYESELLKQLSDKSKVEVPAVLIDEEIERQLNQLKQNLTYRGQTIQEFFAAEGKTEDEYKQDVLRPQAAERVKAGLVLSEVAEQEKIKVSPEELEIRLQVYRNQYKDPEMQKELDKPENQREIASRLLSEKTIAKLVGYTEK